MASWKHCGYYQEMYDLKDTWWSIGPCAKSTQDFLQKKGIDCSGCPLLFEIETDDIPNPYEENE